MSRSTIKIKDLTVEEVNLPTGKMWRVRLGRMVLLTAPKAEAISFAERQVAYNYSAGATT